MKGYLLPVNLGGLQAFAEGAQAPGWYQFAVPGPTLPTFPGITVPPEAQGMLVQARTPIQYSLSPATAAGGGAAALTLPINGTVFLSGQENIRQFCVFLTGNAASFVVQFYQGSIGPVPQINMPPAGGVIPPPPPPAGNIVTIQNVIHVMKNGNDATGTRNRLDLPFLTLNAAAAFLQPGDTLMVWPGTYTPSSSLSVCDVEYHFINALVIADNVDPLFDFSTDDVLTKITGSGTFSNTNPRATGSNLLAFYGTNSKVFAEGSIWINEYGGIANDGSCANDLHIIGKIQSSGVHSCLFGFRRLRVDGDIDYSGPLSAYEAQDDAISAVLNGNINSTAHCIATFSLNDITVNGNLFSSNGSCIDVVYMAKVQVFGNVQSATSDPAIPTIRTDGILNVHGNVTAAARTAIQTTGTDAVCNIYGDIYSATKHGAHSLEGIINVHGNITCDGLTQTANCALSEGESSVINVWGNCSSAGGAAAKTADGKVEVFGNAHSRNRYGAFAYQGGTVIIHGECTSAAVYSAFAEVGNVILYGPTITTGPNVAAAYVAPGGTLTLYAGARLEGTAFYSVTCDLILGGAMTSYFASGNASAAGPVVITGTYNVIP